MIQNIKHEVWISATTVVLGLYGFAQKFRMLMCYVAIFPLALKLPSWKRVDQQLTASKFVCKGWTPLLRRIPLCSNITLLSAARDQSNSLNSAIWLARGTGGIFPSGPALDQLDQQVKWPRYSPSTSPCIMRHEQLNRNSPVLLEGVPWN